MTESQRNVILSEIKGEQTVSPFLPDSTLIQYIKEAEYSINNFCGEMINYDVDLEARSLLKNYVLYANHKKLAEFKQLYAGDYVTVQTRYNRDPHISWWKV